MTAAAAPFDAELTEFRVRRDQALRSPDGWLTAAGLVVLEEGKNELPFGSVVVAGDSVKLLVHPGAEATCLGRPIREQRLRPDQDDDVVHVGRIRYQLIRRGETLAVRVRDPDSATQRTFLGAEWYPSSPAWRLEARVVPLEVPRTLTVAYSIAARETVSIDYLLVFQHDGVTYSLEPIVEPKQLSVLFRDGTNADETSEIGRYLYAPLPQHGRTVLDFNRALSPGCAYSAHVACPLPPPRNTLRVRVEAGEKRPRWAP